MLELKKDLNSLIRLVSNAIDSFTSALFVMDESRSRLELASFHTLSRHCIQDSSIEVGHGLIGWVAQSGESVNVSEFNQDIRSLQYYSVDEEIKAFLAVPVGTQKVRGVLSVDTKRQFAFTSKDQKILTGFAEQFCRVLSHHGAQDPEGGGARALASLLEFHGRLCSQQDTSSILDLLGHAHRELIHCDGAAVILREGKGEDYRIVRVSGCPPLPHQAPIVLDHSLVGWVIRKAQALNLPHLKGYARKTFIFFPGEPELKARSFLGVPLLAEGEVIGVLAFMGKGLETFTPSHLQLASLMAGQASLVLAQAEMKARWRALRDYDPVTGLPNHRSFAKTLEKMARKVAPQREMLYLMMVEPDRSERLVALYGQEVYEGLMRQVARLLERMTGREDSIARAADEGFVLALWQAGHSLAQRFAQRIKDAIEETVFLMGHREIRVTVRIGLFPWPGNEGSVSAFLARSWAAFQMAKGSGRDEGIQFTAK
ncbi:MAG: GAF domain-containing protein [Candidatus Tectomicrobia bacterium]|uniref:GAF domain-containing protein n=1 Tax=Tectimicrobiota bacterium TaxID=2528274 RepID=A0A932CMC6_UNCTE|nr:GAF domain-containing protein [Candidatus Tectomicrobia bacterium]